MSGLGADYITILAVPKDAVLFHVLGDCVEVDVHKPGALQEGQHGALGPARVLCPEAAG